MPVNVFDLAGIDLGLPTGLGVSLGRRAPAYISPEQEQSILGSLLNTGLSGIGMAADVLDTIGGPVRTALAGNWENVLPSILDPSLRTSGRDMLTAWGAPQNQDGFQPFANPSDALWDVAGLGAEVATDPLSYFSPFGLTKAGKLAKSAGLLDDLARVAPNLGKRQGRLATTLDQLIAPRVGETSADLLGRIQRAEEAASGMGVSLDSLSDQRLGGLLSGPLGYAGTGGASQAIARGVDTAGSWLRYGNIPGTNISPGRILGSMFSAPSGEATSRVGQETIMPAAFEARRQAVMAARGDVAEAVGMLRSTGQTGDTLDDYRSLRRLVEGIDQPATPEMGSLISRLRGADDSLIQDAMDWGVSRKLNDPEAKHFYRFLTRSGEKLPEGSGGSLLSEFDQSALSRNEFLNGIEGGTDTLMRIATDPEVQQIIGDVGKPLKARSLGVQKLIKQRYPEVPLDYAPKALQQKGMAPVLASRTKDLSEWLMRMPEDKLKSGIYGNHPLADYAVGRVHAMDRLAGTKTAIQSLADTELMANAWKTSATPGSGVRLGQLLSSKQFKASGGKLKGLSLNRKAALTKIAELRGMPSPGRDDLKALARELVPRDLAEDLMRYHTAFSGPKAVGQMVKALDNVNALFRTGVTSVFPAFHSRNFVSGMVNNFIKGQFSPKAMRQAAQIMRGEAANVADIPAVKRMLAERGLDATKENASDMLRELSYSADAVTRHSDEGHRLGKFSDLQGMFPGGYGGTSGFDIKSSAAKYIGRGEGVSLNPLDIRGVGGREATAFGPAAAGEDFAYLTDGINRLAGMIAGLRKGKNLSDVVRDVDAAQVAYRSKNYTKFEQEVMTRVFPFYKYSRNAMPFMLDELTENPGGRLAKMLRVQDEIREEKPGTPDYVRETASIGLGETPEGADRYITGFGLGYEDPLSFFGGGVRGTALEVLGRLTPVAKLPLEWGTGESFFQKGPMGGREIDDLDPTLGRTVSNLMYQTGLSDEQQGAPVQILGNRTLSQGAEFLAANSPLARLFSTARTVTDPRKFDVREGQVDPFGVMNLLTGVRVSDISPAAQDRVINERADSLMQGMGAKTFSETYFPDEAVAAMGPEDQQKVVQFQMLQRMLDQRRRERRQQQLQQAGGI